MVEVHWIWLALGALVAFAAGQSDGRADGVRAERGRIKGLWRDKVADLTRDDEDDEYDPNRDYSEPDIDADDDRGTLLSDANGDWIGENEDEEKA
jgi:hypothetical protein